MNSAARVIVTNLRTNRVNIGMLLATGSNIEPPDLLAAAVGAGDHIPGELLVPGLPRLAALYHVESPEDEFDPKPEKNRQFWMEDKRLRPGDVVGRAIDPDGTLYAFLSTH